MNNMQMPTIEQPNIEVPKTPEVTKEFDAPGNLPTPSFEKALPSIEKEDIVPVTGEESYLPSIGYELDPKETSNQIEALNKKINGEDPL